MSEARNGTPANAASSSGGTPPAEIPRDEALVTRLLEAQHPDLAALPLKATGEGWDNTMFRLGNKLAVRLPRRAASADLILKEQRWLPFLAGNLPLPVPAPCRIGRPGCGYPWSWSVVPWLEGRSADQSPVAPTQAAVLGRFLRALHVQAPTEAPLNPVRGGPLQGRAETTLARMGRLASRTNLITARIRQIWQTAVEAPCTTVATWLHGDLHARNILVNEGVIAGVVDWGDLCRGDYATDLAVAWMLFPSPDDRAGFWSAYGETQTSTVARAKGWAVFFGMVLLDTGLVDNPVHAKMGSRILAQLSTDAIDA